MNTLTTGTVAASVLSEHYIHNEKERLLTNNSNFSGFSFKYKSYLQIPLAKENHSNDVPALNPLRINSCLQNIFQLAQRVDHPLTDQLNTIYKLDTNEKENFFCLQYQDTYLIAKLDKNKSSVRIKTTQSKIDGQSFQVGKNRYFIFQLDNSPEKTNKMQTLVDESLTDDELLVSQKTIAKH